MAQIHDTIGLSYTDETTFCRIGAKRYHCGNNNSLQPPGEKLYIHLVCKRRVSSPLRSEVCLLVGEAERLRDPWDTMRLSKLACVKAKR